MGVTSGRPHEESAGVNGSGGGPPRCPVCEGALIPLRGHYRCARCYFSLCLGCESLEAPEPADLYE